MYDHAIAIAAVAKTAIQNHPIAVPIVLARRSPADSPTSSYTSCRMPRAYAAGSVDSAGAVDSAHGDSGHGDGRRRVHAQAQERLVQALLERFGVCDRSGVERDPDVQPVASAKCGDV